MSQHEKFNFKTLDEMKAKVKELNADIKFDEDISPLLKKVKVGDKEAPNAMAILPMEGCDSNLDGSPSELVFRRYKRFSEGGSGLIWWEANAVVSEGKANPRQMMITDNNLDEFKKLIDESKKAAVKKNGTAPLNILQLTHSGRYSRPEGHKGAPIIPQHDPLLDPRVGLHGDEPVVTDEYLDSLPEKYAKSALLAKKAGFDGADVKACHRYLMSEVLASFTRDGKYGGSFENRTRLIRDCVRAVREACGDDFIISSRFNVFDAHPYPYGFGCDKDDMWKFDPTEPQKLVSLLTYEGVKLLTNSAGNPYYIYPQVTRPFDLSSMGIPTPDEHPLESTARLFEFTKAVQKSAKEVPVIGNGYTWLRQFAPYAASANIKAGNASFMGFGRGALAYPDAPRDLINNGEMDPKKCCITCSKCTQIMRDHGSTGCVVRDGEVYRDLYKKAREDAASREKCFQ